MFCHVVFELSIIGLGMNVKAGFPKGTHRSKYIGETSIAKRIYRAPWLKIRELDKVGDMLCD